MTNEDKFILFVFPAIVLIIGGIIWFYSNKNFLRANKAFNKGEYEKAIALYEGIIAKNKNHKIAYFNMGKALEILKQYDKAIDAYDEIIRIDKNFIAAYLRKQAIFKIFEKYEDVLNTYEELNRINQEINNKEANKLVYFSKGAILCDKLNRNEEALKAYDEAIKIDPNYEDALRGKGIILDNKLGNYEEAVKVYNEIARINPKHSGNYLNKGIALGILGRIEESIESFNKALETYDEWIKVAQNEDIINISGFNKGTIYYLKASTYAFTNDIQETLNNLNEAIKIDNKRKENVKSDKNFDKICNSEEFKKIIG